MDNKQARLIVNTSIEIGEDARAHLVIWKVPQPVPGSVHGFKYRLAYVVSGECVLRYDNEAGKGDHRHWGPDETAYAFSDTDTLIDDFHADIMRWNHENGAV